MPSQEEIVTHLESEVGNALARCDREALQRLFADDFIGTNPMRIEMTKADVIAQIKRDDLWQAVAAHASQLSDKV